MKLFSFSLIFIISLFVLVAAMFLAISYGAKEMTLGTVWTAVIDYNPKLTAHQIIHELRLPRVIGAAVMGAAFAVAGALMQGVTRNPLADAGILGINSGATFAVALSFAFFPNLPYSALIAISFTGAVLSTLFIFMLGRSAPGGLTPLRPHPRGSSGSRSAAFIKLRDCDLLQFGSGFSILVRRRCCRGQMGTIAAVSSSYSDYYRMGLHDGAFGLSGIVG